MNTTILKPIDVTNPIRKRMTTFLYMLAGHEGFNRNENITARQRNVPLINNKILKIMKILLGQRVITLIEFC